MYPIPQKFSRFPISKHFKISTTLDSTIFPSESVFTNLSTSSQSMTRFLNCKMRIVRGKETTIKTNQRSWDFKGVVADVNITLILFGFHLHLFIDLMISVRIYYDNASIYKVMYMIIHIS